MSTEVSVPGKTNGSGLPRFQTSWGSEFAGFEGNPDFVLSLARGLRVIESFSAQSEGLSITEITRRTSLSRAAVRRLLITLELLGYVEAVGRLYRLSHRILRLGLSFLSSNTLATMAQPAVQHMVEELHEACGVGVLDGDEVLFVAGAIARRIMSPSSSVGIRLPAYGTSLGRVLLAALPEDQLRDYLDRVELKHFTPKSIVCREAFVDEMKRVKSQGYCLVDEELELGLRSISVPIVSRHGRVAASLGLATQSSRNSVREMLARFLPILKEHARVFGEFAS